MIEARDRIVVWVDSREARIARRHGAAVELERVPSDVPPHANGVGHVRHDSTGQHGAAGDAQGAAERRRIEHLEAFLADVAERLSPDADLEVLGPGTVHALLARRLRQADTRHRRDRTVVAIRSMRLTPRQLTARLRSPEATTRAGR